MHVFVDITNVKRLEKEQTTNRCLHIMFSSISHEFRTPLNAFANAVDLININFDMIEKVLERIELNREDSTSIQLWSDYINRSIMTSKISSKTLLYLTEDILDFAKIEAGMFKLNERSFNLSDLISEIVFIFDFQWTQKGIKLFIQDEKVKNVSFCSDPDRIKQILMNLISNAYKFTNEGSITLDFSLIEIDEWNCNSRALKIDVIDTGIGISKEDVQSLFQLFGIIDKHRQEFNMKGTGLGLTISKKLVNILGGEIQLESKEQKGTKISFTIQEKKRNIVIEETKIDNTNSNLRENKLICEQSSFIKYQRKMEKNIQNDWFDCNCIVKLLI